MKLSRIFVVLTVLLSLDCQGEDPPLLPVTIFAEDFDGAYLQDPVSEYDPNPGVPDWATPETSGRGWVRGDDDVTGGTTEWLGWSFTTTTFWVGNDDQSRSTIFPVSATEVVAVADSDEAEDGGITPIDGFNAYLRTPLIDLAGFSFDSLELTFDSSFRFFGNDQSFVRFIFDVAAPLYVEIPDQGTTLTPMSIQLATISGAPLTASSLVIEFAHEKADNSWWWTIDNILLTGNPAVPNPTNTLPVVSSSTPGPVQANLNDRFGYAFSAADPDLDRVQLSIDWGDGNSTSSSLFPSGDQVDFEHTWEAPGVFPIQVRAIDEQGGTSGWGTVLSVTVSSNASITLVTPPYLQNVRTNGIVIMCESQVNVPLEVEFGADETYGQSVAMTRVSSGGGTWFHRALLNGMQPGTQYHYRVNATGGSELTEDAVFETAPLGAPDFKFSVWSDSQGHNHGVWTADPLEPTISMMKHMVASGVSFGLTAGDLAENGGSYTDTRQFYLDRVARHLGTSVPWFAAWGNHDTSNPNSPLRLASDMPSRYRAGFSPGHGSFSFVYADCFFLCVDNFQQNDISNGWVEQQLASEAAQSARFRFLGVHVPPFCERWIDGSVFLRDNLVPLMEQYNVDFCFSGHTHEYERGELNHVHYVITGGGSWLDHTEPIVRDWGHIFVGGSHDVTGAWAAQSSHGVLGTPQPIVGGLFNEYALVTIRENYLKLEAHGFHADGSEIGVLDSMEIGVDPGLDTDGDGLRDPWEIANGLDPADPNGVNGPSGDLDGDGLTNREELIAGTFANDASSVLSIMDLQRDEAGLWVTWSSQPGKEYLLDTTTTFAPWEPVMDNDEPLVFIGAASGTTTSTLIPDFGSDQGFVRIRIK